MAETPQGFTVILGQARAGDERARGELIVQIYGELRRVASRLMRRERPDHTLPPTAVVHDAVIRLLAEGGLRLGSGPQLPIRLGGAGDAGGAHRPRPAAGCRTPRRGRRRVALDAVVGDFEGRGLDLVAVHEALDRRVELDGRQAQVITRRYFGGMTVAAVAAALGVSVATVEHDWRLARAWLAGQLGGWDG